MNAYQRGRLLIIDHYESLVREVDIYAEKLLEQSTQKGFDKIPNEDDERREHDSDEKIETYGIDARIDPYIGQYCYDDEACVNLDKFTSVNEFVNATRTKAIEELTKAQSENLKRIEQLNINVADLACEELESQVFEKKFCFVIEIDFIGAVDIDGHVERIRSRVWSLYAIETDFYMSQSDIKLLKWFENMFASVYRSIIIGLFMKVFFVWFYWTRGHIFSTQTSKVQRFRTLIDTNVNEKKSFLRETFLFT